MGTAFISHKNYTVCFSINYFLLCLLMNSQEGDRHMKRRDIFVLGPSQPGGPDLDQALLPLIDAMENIAHTATGDGTPRNRLASAIEELEKMRLPGGRYGATELLVRLIKHS